jgi:hypothetical protein
MQRVDDLLALFPGGVEKLQIGWVNDIGWKPVSKMNQHGGLKRSTRVEHLHAE